ncbi:aldehyde ferredoxin oxidoreductase C-terminal domain-containing protein, partial [Chloroflexota bacterium]
IRDASHIWGKDTWDTTDAIWDMLGRKYTVASIGPAGENLVATAAIVTNKYSTFGRTGLGAVMGSKNLKAIAINGNHKIAIANPEKFSSLVDSMTREIMSLPHIQDFRRLGTLWFVKPLAESKIIGYRNFERGMTLEEILEKFDPEKLDGIMERHGNIACMGCPVGCKHSFWVNEGPYAGLKIPVSCAEVWMVEFGCRGGVDSGGWSEILRCIELGNRMGLDASIGSSLIGVAIDLFQRGIINRSDTDGLELDWRPEVAQDLLRKIAYREGFGDILADGPIEAGRRIGKGTSYYFLHHKGVPVPSLDTRLWPSTYMFSHVISPSGRATHINSMQVEGLSTSQMRTIINTMGLPEIALKRILPDIGGYNMAVMTKWMEDYSFAMECLGLCLWDHTQRFGLDRWAEVYTAATGIEIEPSELLAAAARGFDMSRSFFIREGGTRKDDTMPERYLAEEQKVANEICPPIDRDYMNKFISDYYIERGWDPIKGTVNPNRLSELLR